MRYVSAAIEIDVGEIHWRRIDQIYEYNRVYFHPQGKSDNAFHKAALKNFNHQHRLQHITYSVNGEQSKNPTGLEL